MDIEITDLRFRSIGDNILMYNFTHNTNKDLAATMPELTTQTLGIDVSLVRILRNGVRLKKSNHQVSITAKLTDRIKKDKILNAQKINEIACIPRNKLIDKSDSLKKQNISVNISRNSIVLPNGSKYNEEVPLFSKAEVLHIDQAASEQFDDIVTKYRTHTKNGSEFYATGTKFGSVDQTQNFYKK